MYTPDMQGSDYLPNPEKPKMITAEHARLESQSIAENKIISELQDVEIKIKEAVRKGQGSLTYCGDLSVAAKMKLSELGYNVIYNSPDQRDQRDRGSHTIKWA